MSYTQVNVAKPKHGTVCVVFTNAGIPHIAVFRKEMGDVSAGGDFATFNRKAKGIELNHLPDVGLWKELEGPTE